MNSLNELISALWEDYSNINKQAFDIHSLLESKGETIVNDHIAFRTFNTEKIGINALAKHFIDFGYEEKGEHHFKAKKLYAKHYEHPDINQPLVFISELLLEEFSEDLQSTINALVDNVPQESLSSNDILVSGTQWPSITYETYQKLKDESEYAAWLAVFGFRANHFTVLVNSLKNIKSLQELNNLLKQYNFTLNSSGGEIKGSPNELLEQSSTLAYTIEINFSNQTQQIPSCYYEFAKRYPLDNGQLFRGFIAQSADKIFESTDNK